MLDYGLWMMDDELCSGRFADRENPPMSPFMKGGIKGGFVAAGLLSRKMYFAPFII